MKQNQIQTQRENDAVCKVVNRAFDSVYPFKISCFLLDKKNEVLGFLYFFFDSSQ